MNNLKRYIPQKRVFGRALWAPTELFIGGSSFPEVGVDFSFSKVRV